MILRALRTARLILLASIAIWLFALIYGWSRPANYELFWVVGLIASFSIIISAVVCVVIQLLILLALKRRH
jgi:hypothetical protein